MSSDEEKRSVWKKILGFIAGAVAGIIGFIFVRRSYISGNGNGADAVRKQLDDAGDGVEQSKGTLSKLADSIDESATVVSELDDSFDESAAVISRLDESIERSSDVVEDSRRILENIRKRNE